MFSHKTFFRKNLAENNLSVKELRLKNHIFGEKKSFVQKWPKTDFFKKSFVQMWWKISALEAKFVVNDDWQK